MTASDLQCLYVNSLNIPPALKRTRVQTNSSFSSKLLRNSWVTYFVPCNSRQPSTAIFSPCFFSPLSLPLTSMHTPAILSVLTLATTAVSRGPHLDYLDTFQLISLYAISFLISPSQGRNNLKYTKLKKTLIENVFDIISH